MEKKIITISREFGSGGRSIGKRVAQELGIPYYDKEIVDQIALESGFAPKFVEENGEHSPGTSRLSYAFAPQLFLVSALKITLTRTYMKIKPRMPSNKPPFSFLS